MSINKFLRGLLPIYMSRQVKELFVSTTLVNFALAMVMLFEPIYLYQIGYPLQKIMLFYMITYVLYFFLMPLGGKFASKKGYESGILVGTILWIIFYVALYFIAKFDWLFYVAPVIFAVQKMFYWPSYHADFARYSDDREEGREISGITVAGSLVYIIGPAVAGFIIYEWGYGALFTLASIIFLISNVPTLVTKEVFMPGQFSYAETYKALTSKEQRRAVFSYLGYGEELILMTVWPIFIALIINNALDIGLIVALATLVTTIITLFIGRLSDMKNKRKVLRLGAAFYSLSWFVRLFVTATGHVFFVDTLSRLGKNTVMVPQVALTYEMAKAKKVDAHRHVMRSVLIYESSLVLGKLLAILIIFFALYFIGTVSGSFAFVFILAGAMSLLYMLL